MYTERKKYLKIIRYLFGEYTNKTSFMKSKFFYPKRNQRLLSHETLKSQENFLIWKIFYININALKKTDSIESTKPLFGYTDEHIFNWLNFFVVLTKNLSSQLKRLSQRDLFVTATRNLLSQLKNLFTHVRTKIQLTQLSEFLRMYIRYVISASTE